MQSDSRVVHYFNEVEQTMELKFRGWEKDIPHQGEKGGIRERRVADFLSLVLPKRFGIGTGHIIDNRGTLSHQTDIVIYDADNGISLPGDDYYSLYPCECVYAVIEVKSILCDSTIKECLERNSTVKALNRERGQLDPIHYVVFAYSTRWEKDPQRYIKEHFERLAVKSSQKVPEVVFVLKPGFVLGTSGPTGYNDTGKLTNLYDFSPLLYFTSDLIYRLSQTKVATPNLWYEYVDRQPGDIICQIWNRKAKA